MSKITKVSPGFGGHLHFDLEDGTSVVIHRGNHEHHELKAGDNWPPLPVEEVSAEAEEKAAEESAEEASAEPELSFADRIRKALGA